MNTYEKINKPMYNSENFCWCIKEIYLTTEPFDNLFSLKEFLFYKKEDAYRELILYLYFEYDYDPSFSISNVNNHKITDNDMKELDTYLEKHLNKYGFSWEISGLKILYNKEEK